MKLVKAKLDIIVHENFKSKYSVLGATYNPPHTGIIGDILNHTMSIEMLHTIFAIKTSPQS